MSLIVFGFFVSKIKKNKSNIRKISYWIYFVILVLLFEWFYNHPSLRYGGFFFFSSFFFFLVKFKQNIPKLTKKLTILLILVSFIFVTRNIIRINAEIEKYNFKPLKDYNFRITEHHYRINKEINDLIENYQLCKSNNLEHCTKNSKYKIFKINEKYVINRK